jgi:RNA polymerase sigma-70 factor, ECF subfamily
MNLASLFVESNGENIQLENELQLVSDSTTQEFSEYDDFSLAKMASEGNLESFETIYRRHYRRVYNLCLRMLNDVSEAEDLTQEVFIQLYRKIKSFRGDSAFSTWLYRLTVNQVLMHFRKKQVKNEKTTEDGEMPPQIINQESTSNVNQIDKIAIEKAIKQLPRGYRTVFVLHDIEGFEHEEIAKMLGLSVGTSKSQLHKARLKLRNLLLKKQ